MGKFVAEIQSKGIKISPEKVLTKEYVDFGDERTLPGVPVKLAPSVP